MERQSPQRAVAFNLVLLLVFSLLCFVSCSVQKRHYRKGFYVHLNHAPQGGERSKHHRPNQKSHGAGPMGVKELVVYNNSTQQPRFSCNAEKNHVAAIPVAHKPLVSSTNRSVRGESFVAAPAAAVKREGQGRTVEWMGLAAFLVTAGAWVALVLYPVTLLQVALFAIGAGLAALSMTKMSREPDRYLFRTLSFVALLLALIGLAVLLYAALIYLLS